MSKIALLIFTSISLFLMSLAAPPHRDRNLVAISGYIKRTWAVLTRSHQDLAAAAQDPKSRPAADGRWPVYVPAIEDIGHLERQLRSLMKPADFRKIALHPLPK